MYLVPVLPNKFVIVVKHSPCTHAPTPVIFIRPCAGAILHPLAIFKDFAKRESAIKRSAIGARTTALMLPRLACLRGDFYDRAASFPFIAAKIRLRELSAQGTKLTNAPALTVLPLHDAFN